MSQRDLTAELRAARITAPDEVRERVRSIAATDSTPTHRFTLRGITPHSITLRRALVVALPVAAAVAATIVFTRPGGEQPTAARELDKQANVAGVAHAPAAIQPNARAAATQKTFSAVPPTPGRVQQVEASLSLRLPTSNGVSGAIQRALRIAQSFGGYPVYVDAGSHQRSASADLTLKVPRAHVREAVARLSALGTITAEHFEIQDLEAGINGTDRTMARLQRTLAGLRAQVPSPTVQRKIAALTTRIAQLQRQRATTIRSAHFATVNLHLATPQAAARHAAHHGPLHGLGVAFHWIWIGAVYAFALGAPIAVLLILAWLAVRVLRRRRVDALLSRP
jgi:hypothetical protein